MAIKILPRRRPDVSKNKKSTNAKPEKKPNTSLYLYLAMSTVAVIFLSFQLTMSSNYLTEVLQSASIVHDAVLPTVRNTTTTTTTTRFTTTTKNLTTTSIQDSPLKDTNVSNLQRRGGDYLQKPFIDDANANSENNDKSKNGNNHDDFDGRMNVIILYPDDWRYDSIGDARPGVVHTPFLTRLAKEGIRFTHNAVTSSICWMSRATLFTGRYVSQHQSIRNICPIFTAPFMWNGTWPYILQQFGNYFVGHVGKWQYELRNNHSALFDWSSFEEGSHWYTKKGLNITAAEKSRNDAIKFLRQRPKDRNFALTVAFYPPKPIGDSSTPGGQWHPDDKHKQLYQNQTFDAAYNYSQAFAYVPEFLQSGITRNRYLSRYNTSTKYQASMRNYHALVSQIDDACRDIVNELENQGVKNQTVIIVTADNGMMMGAHGLGGKWIPYQESIRVPLVVYDPRMAKSKRGTTDDSYTLNIDLASTIVGAAKLKPDPRMQGRDMADIYVPLQQQLKSKQDDDGSHITKEEDFQVNHDPWREDYFYEFPLEGIPQSTALVTRQYKYIRWYGKNPRYGTKLVEEQLFDLQHDPYEFHDMLSKHNYGPPLDLLRQVGSTLVLCNVSEVTELVRERHRQLEDTVRRRVPGEATIPCEKNYDGTLYDWYGLPWKNN